MVIPIKSRRQESVIGISSFCFLIFEKLSFDARCGQRRPTQRVPFQFVRSANVFTVCQVSERLYSLSTQRVPFQFVRSANVFTVCQLSKRPSSLSGQRTSLQFVNSASAFPVCQVSERLYSLSTQRTSFQFVKPSSKRWRGSLFSW